MPPRADANQQIEALFAGLLQRFDELDHEGLDVDAGDGKLTIAFEAGGGPIILSRQGAVGQVWMAEPAGGWHFDWDGRAWRCDKRGVELIGNLETLIADRLREPIDLSG